MNKQFLIFIFVFIPAILIAQQQVPVKPRILISTDIGGMNPDDNQSMAHFLTYSYLFENK